MSLWDRAWRWLNERADWLVDYGTDDADLCLSVWEFPNTVDPRAYNYPDHGTDDADGSSLCAGLCGRGADPSACPSGCDPEDVS